MISLFQSKLAFQPVDPLGDGLGDDIAKEQSEPEAEAFQEDIDAGNLTNFWEKVEQDVQQDPEWYTFTED
jgi:hypothetical protein